MVASPARWLPVPMIAITSRFNTAFAKLGDIFPTHLNIEPRPRFEETSSGIYPRIRLIVGSGKSFESGSAYGIIIYGGEYTVTRTDKLYARIVNNPKDVNYEELDKLLLKNVATLDQDRVTIHIAILN
ncbi:MAG: hypothetical protein PHW39_01580 [Syntrophomonadaceae bacterium]|nr:hypothetical protein [Syntrophomonadaceae bacterium]MDD4561749.1 hypothetical protein [Syntrophomonadaceae bacterium]